MQSRLVATAAITCAVAASGGCSTSGSGSAAPTVTATVTVTESGSGAGSSTTDSSTDSPTASTTASSAGTESTAADASGTDVAASPAGSDAGTASADPAADPATDAATDPSAESTNVVVPQSAAGSTLTKSQFFNPSDDWDEARYDIGSKSALQGIGSTVSSCGATYGSRKLELRLANRFSTLTFTAGQSNQSESAQDKLVVAVLANNRQVDSRAIPFNATQGFTIDVKGVNSLVIQTYLDDSVPGCSSRGGVEAVISNVVVR